VGTELTDRGSELDEVARAKALSRAYSLLARLVSRGPAATIELEAATADAGIATAVASYRGDLDALAVDHQHVFGFSCPPFESAMLDPEGHFGNETSDRVRDALAATGIAEGPDGEEPDHLATQLYALALLAGAEADAREDGETATALGMQARARRILDAHLLRWLPSYALAVRRTARAWPAALMHTIEETVLLHRSCVGAPEQGDVAFELPPLGVSLDDEATGLEDIARVLARPARAGLLISRDDAAYLGRSSNTPRGFGDRVTLIENLLRAGAQLGTIGHVLSSLGELLDEVSAQLTAERLADVPIELRAPWQARIAETRALLERMREASRDAR